MSQNYFNRLIELLAYWEGEVRPAQLQRFTGISRQYASGLLKKYREEAPDGISYDKAKKIYLTTEQFVPQYITKSVNEYLNWLVGYSTALETPLPTQRIELPARHITPAFIRPIVKAMREQRRLEVDYLSISNPDYDGRIIVPHHLVKTTLRWHVRAWCEKNQGYRDFVLSRFRGEPELLDKSPQTAEQDKGWQAEVQVKLAADDRLNAEQRKVIEREFGMENGVLCITTKGCLVSYLLQALNIDPNAKEENPIAQQLIVTNKDEIADWLF